MVDAWPDRVLVLTPDAGGRHGVAEVTRQVLRALAGASPPRRLEVWSLDRGPPAGGPWGAREARGSRRLLTGWGAAAALRPGSPSRTLVVCLHLHLAPVALPLAARGARLATFLHGIEAWAPLGALRRVALAASDLLSNSDHTTKRFRAANPWADARRVTTCHLGLGDPAAAPRGLVPVVTRTPRAMILGRMSAGERYKGHDELLTVWPDVRAIVPDAQLDVVGAGDDRGRLEARARAAGLDGCVRFHGELDEAALARLFEQVAALVMPSAGEGFGLAFLEAMQRGVPCLAGRGAAEEVVGEEAGVLVEPSDLGGLTSGLARLLGEPATRARLGAAGQARWAARFTAPAFHARLRAALGLVEAS